MAKRLLLSLALAVAATVATLDFALAQSQPEFKLGFATMAQLIPQVVGQPLENERHDPVTGNAIQRTTTGLMVWRAASNVTAFTDGARTWINGPFGLQVRSNDTRFDWESPHGDASTIEEAIEPSLPLDVGTTRPLDVDPSLVGATQELRRVDDGEWLVRVAAENGAMVRSRPTPAGVLGAFFPTNDLVIVSSLLDASSVQARAAVLAHELQHAADAAAGIEPQTPIQCLNFEARAFARQASVWAMFWGNDLPPPVDAIHAELNEVTLAVGHDPQGFAAELVRRYGSDCGLIP